MSLFEEFEVKEVPLKSVEKKCQWGVEHCLNVHDVRVTERQIYGFRAAAYWYQDRPWAIFDRSFQGVCNSGPITVYSLLISLDELVSGIFNNEEALALPAKQKRRLIDYVANRFGIEYQNLKTCRYCGYSLENEPMAQIIYGVSSKPKCEGEPYHADCFEEWLGIVSETNSK